MAEAKEVGVVIFEGKENILKRPRQTLKLLRRFGGRV